MFLIPSQGARRTLRATKQLAQNGLRRGSFLASSQGARRTLCAIKQPAQNAVRREPFLGSSWGARRTLCALPEISIAAWHANMKPCWVFSYWTPHCFNR
jgi:hypothetical protein